MELISAKIDSLKDLTVVNTNSVTPWSDVVARRRIESFTLQNKPCEVPVISNRYDVLLMKDVVEKQTVQVQCNNNLKVEVIPTRKL
jgi:hypothetical protein